MIPEFKIIKSKRKSISIEIKNGIVTVRCPYFLSKEQLEKEISKHEKWIQTRLNEYNSYTVDDIAPFTDTELENIITESEKKIPPLVKRWAEIMNVDYKSISIKKLLSCWGSCSYDGKLSFNCLLILFPDNVIESVIIHELTHRLVHNHQKEFYDVLLTYCPDYAACRKELNSKGKLLLIKLRNTINTAKENSIGKS